MKYFLFLTLVFLNCKLLGQKASSNKMDTLNKKISVLGTAKNGGSFSKVDSVQSIQINFLKEELSRINFDTVKLKESKSDWSKYGLAILTFFLGAAFTIGREAYKEWRLEKRTIKRWKAALSILNYGCQNQVKHNDFVIERLQEENITGIIPIYEYSLYGNEFSSLDKGTLYHYLEKIHGDDAAKKNNTILTLVGAISDLQKKNDMLREEYQVKIERSYDNRTIALQELQRDLGKLWKSYESNVNRTPGEKDLISTATKLFQERFLNEISDPENVKADDAALRQINFTSQELKKQYDIEQILASTMAGIHSIASVYGARKHYSDQLKVLTEHLKEYHSALPKALTYF